MNELPWDRILYWLAESGNAARAERGESSTIWDEHAFLSRWGTTADLAERLERVERLIGWWVLPKGLGASSETDAADNAAVDGLLVARGRLKALCAAAEAVEGRLRERGYAWDDADQTIKAVNDGPGPRAFLVSEAITKTFEHLVGEGWDRANTSELRAEIRDRLTGLALLPPDLVTDTKIKSAVNTVLNPCRHY